MLRDVPLGVLLPGDFLKQFEAVGGERCLQLFIMSLSLILNDEGVTVSKMDFEMISQRNLKCRVCRDKT